MRKSPLEEGLRWLEQGSAIPTGLPDGIPARVFNARLAQDAVGLAEDAVRFVADLLKPLK